MGVFERAEKHEEQTYFLKQACKIRMVLMKWEQKIFYPYFRRRNHFIGIDDNYQSMLILEKKTTVVKEVRKTHKNCENILTSNFI
ncbi:hypothetical protein CWI39_1789p0010 [Hamiltosporidium magnivora]|nr:hypothetical protein CWI39_1789p0010 [Hamiltosporidium magnivora]